MTDENRWGPEDAREFRKADPVYKAPESRPMTRRDREGLGGVLIVSAALYSPFVLWDHPIAATVQTTLLLVIGFRKVLRAVAPCLIPGHAWRVFINTPVKTCDRCGKIGWV